MPGGPLAGYERMKPVLVKIAAQVDDGPCVTYIGEGGAGNYVKMIHNGIEYGDMQLIAEAYDILKNVGKLTNDELAATFKDWNTTELESFLIEITAQIFTKKDETGYIVDAIKDKTGQKGTGRMTIQEAAELSVPSPTISAALDARNLSALLDERKKAHTILQGPEDNTPVDKKQLIADVKYALYAAKICSYSQGMNLIRTAGKAHDWKLNLGEIARIWKGGCIIRARFLDRIKTAYDRSGDLANLMIDPEFAKEMNDRHAALRRVVVGAINKGISVGAFSGSLFYYDSYRRDRLPANLTQAQRDFFGAHTYERLDKEGAFHTEWAQQ
jgi:6-phosphogluconate dehydrogenase